MLLSLDSHQPMLNAFKPWRSLWKHSKASYHYITGGLKFSEILSRPPARSPWQFYDDCITYWEPLCRKIRRMRTNITGGIRTWSFEKNKISRNFCAKTWMFLKNDWERSRHLKKKSWINLWLSQIFGVSYVLHCPYAKTPMGRGGESIIWGGASYLFM